jgi:intein/homing endonuclease
MIRILAVDGPNVDGVSWWRNIRPLTELQRVYPDIQVKFVGENVSLQELMQADVVIMFRPVTAKSVQFIETCKTPLFNIKVIIDIDDNLWRLPPGHPSEADYNEQAANLRKIYSMADGIWCSTEPLMYFADAMDGRGVVVPNAVLERDLPTKPSPYKGFVCWRGSVTQIADVQNEQAIEDFEANHDKFARWFFWGYHPAPYRTPKSKGLPRVDVVKYIAGLNDVGINIMWKPLQENEFNDSKCLVGGTLLMTGTGVKRISDIGLHHDQCISDWVWQSDGFKQAEKFFKYEDREVVTIRTSFGYEISGTKNHKLRIGGSFVKMGDLKVSDLVELTSFNWPNLPYQQVAYPMFKSFEMKGAIVGVVNDELLPKVTINERWGRFLGYLIGDGHLTGSNRVSISCDSRHTEVVDDIKLFASEIGVTCGASIKRVNGVDGHGVDLHLSSKTLRKMIADKMGFVGVKGKILRVPDVILASPKSVVKEFLRGIFETDGTVASTGCSFTTKQRELASDVQFLLLGFGIKCNIRAAFNQKYRKTYYTLALGREAAEIFHIEINFISKNKQDRLSEICSKSHSNAFKPYSMEDEIVEISYSQADVYDIEVPDGHYYMANGFISHNSNIAWIEATLAGGICVTNYATKPGWEWAVDHFTDNADFIASQWAASRAAIVEHYNLEKINSIRYHHILRVLGVEGKPVMV